MDTTLEDNSALVTYLNKLENSQLLETINFHKLYAKIACGEKIRIYCGYQLSGPMHIGTFMTFAILLNLAKFKNVQVICLLADFHTTLNKKELDPTLEQQMRNLAHRANVPIQFVKSEDNGLGYMYSTKFHLAFNQIAKNIKLTHLKKSVQFFKRDAITELSVAEITYICYQITDIQCLDIDLAIGGSDQRRLHMIHNDRVAKKSYLHIPLLVTADGTKMSKSVKHSLVQLETLTAESICSLWDYKKFREYIEQISGIEIILYLKSLGFLNN